MCFSDCRTIGMLYYLFDEFVKKYSVSGCLVNFGAAGVLLHDDFNSLENFQESGILGVDFFYYYFLKLGMEKGRIDSSTSHSKVFTHEIFTAGMSPQRHLGE